MPVHFRVVCASISLDARGSRSRSRSPGRPRARTRHARLTNMSFNELPGPRDRQLTTLKMRAEHVQPSSYPADADFTRDTPHREQAGSRNTGSDYRPGSTGTTEESCTRRYFQEKFGYTALVCLRCLAIGKRNYSVDNENTGYLDVLAPPIDPRTARVKSI